MNFLAIGLRIFLITAVIAPRDIANKIAKAPNKNGFSLETFTVNSAKVLRLSFNIFVF